MSELPEGLFVGLTREEIQAMRATAVKLITEGKTLMSTSNAGVSFSKQFSLPPDKVLRECTYALKMMSGGIIRQVRPDFSGRGRYQGGRCG